MLSFIDSFLVEFVQTPPSGGRAVMIALKEDDKLIGG